MIAALSTFALLAFTASYTSDPDTVRISMFTLFKPEILHARVAVGDGVVLESFGRASTRFIPRGELIRIRLSGNRLNIVTGERPRRIEQVVASAVRIAPTASGTVELILPGRVKRVVRGAISVDTGPDGRGPLRIVLTTDRESAVASVVAAETNRRETEALKALAVVVRTFILFHAGRHSSEGFDFCDTTHCQLYRGEPDLAERVTAPAVDAAVASTTQQFLSYDGQPVEGYYTAACGGLSATPSMVWGGESKYPYTRIACQWCHSFRFGRWQRSASAASVLESLFAFTGSRLSSATELIAECDQPSGFVRSVIVVDGNKRMVLGTDSFRRAIGLRLGWNTVLSPTFKVERRGT